MKKPYLQKIQTGCFLQLKLSKFSQLKSRIKKNEGYSNQIYYDQVGKPTIGFGHLIKKREKFLHQKKYSKKYLNKIFDNDFSAALSDFNKSYKAKGLSKNSQEVLLEMIFQLGIKNCLKFKKFNKSLKKKLLHMAALEMLNSHWYAQTPKRVEKLMAYAQKKPEDYTKEEMRKLIEKEEKEVITTLTATVGMGAVLTMLGIPKLL